MRALFLAVFVVLENPSGHFVCGLLLSAPEHIFTMTGDELGKYADITQEKLASALFRVK